MKPTPSCTHQSCECIREELARVERKLKLAEDQLVVIAKSFPIGHECAAQERARVTLEMLREGK